MKLVALQNTYSLWRPESINDVNLDVFKASKHELFGLNITMEEISIICPTSKLPVQPSGKVEHDWKGFKVQGPLDFSLTGILASIANPLAENNISIFAVSTFDTDYVLVKTDQFEKAKAILGNNFEIEENK